MLQIAETDWPDAAVRPHALRGASLPPARAGKPETPVGPASTLPKDSRPPLPETDRGLGLLLSFAGALVVMVADVVVLNAVGRSWILIPGFAVLLLMTAIVFVVIMRLLADDGEDRPPDAR
jgi:hypothetical protein